jgi:hypothetical protein
MTKLLKLLYKDHIKILIRDMKWSLREKGAVLDFDIFNNIYINNIYIFYFKLLLMCI